ncbi:MAG: hypothetical protein NZ959_02935 [Armatimonadetes bacterium]|nr:hypothetical protein [Armatimonadota bacterium]MDW8121594.1 hypothetical protein [Armatimonadota bacterium]
MARKKQRRDIPDQSELKLQPSEWLRWYAEHLRQVLSEYARRRTCEREDLELVLLDRSDLERAAHSNPEAFGAAERKRLRELDEKLRTLGPAIQRVMPDIRDVRKQLEIPRSHWWWYMDQPPQRSKGGGDGEPTR